ncbi:hypothetical protein BJY04DRAFT_142848 [Aspergillus karnatakaensis]|uniref:putative GPI anchored protein n=1 Tax=Aspergillus karnatakaensis TaxID=1810916 RepID=UPI003CCDE001
MLSKSLLLPAMASLAYAESTVTSMFMYGSDPQPLAASIVGNDATATTYLINCTPGTPGDECGMGPGMTLIARKDVTSWIFDDAPSFVYTAQCSIKGTDAICTESAGGPDANFPGVETTTTTVDYQPVTITAGSITDAEPTATSTAESTDSVAESTQTSSAAQASETASQTASETESATETETGDAEDATPTGAAVRLTGTASAVFAAVAVAVGLGLAL